MTEPTREEVLSVSPDMGLWLPEDMRDFDRQVVFRTPSMTTQHYGSDPLGIHYPLVRPGSFGDAEELRDARNPELAPNLVSIKKEGEEAEVFEVELHEEDLP